MNEVTHSWTSVAMHARIGASVTPLRLRRYSDWAESESLPMLDEWSFNVKPNGVLVTLLVDDYDAALDFYVEKLGLFDVVADTQTSESSRYVCIALKDFVDKFVIHLKAPATSLSDSLVGRQGGDDVLITLPVEDIESVRCELASKGVPIEQNIEWVPWGGGTCVTDPFGNRLSLFQHFVSRFS